MRKRISCKIIKSVPLKAVENRSECCVLSTAFSAVPVTPYGERKIGTSTYNHRLIVTTICIDEKPTARILDCCA